MPIENPASQFGNSQFVVDPVVGRGSFTTVNAALAASASGDTIYIRPGTYTENLTSNMAGKSIIGAAVGTNAFEVQIVGNHSFTSNAATVAFQSVGFSAAAGTVWTVGSAGAGNSSLFLEGCQVLAPIGTGVQITSAGGTGSLQSFYTAITGSTVGINAANGTMRLEGSTVTGQASNALQIGASMSVTASNMTFSAPASDAVLISSATGDLHSEICSYDSALAAFHFTADGTVTTITDSVDSSNPSGLFADATGAFGNLEYAALVLLGTATGIDPQVTAIALPVISSSGMVTESIAVNQTLQANHRYFVTGGALVLPLPAMATPGDVIEVILRGGTSWQVTQAAGQQIHIGIDSTTLGVGGSLTSTAAGDSIALVCSVSNTTWVVNNSYGNITVV